MDTLKLTNPMMHGPAVVRLQEFGDQLGFDYGPNDGVFGPTTERVVKDLQAHLKLPVTGICDQQTWNAIIAHLDQGPIFQDQFIINTNHDHPKLYNKPRTWNSIVGVTLHQTGCRMPRDPMKWKNLNAHIGLTEDGVVVLCNPFTDFIWHAQGLSQRTVGIEISGNFYGVEGNESTLWKGGGPAAVLNDKQLKGADFMFDYISNEFSKHNINWQAVRAHRQSSKTRHGDPGSAIWQKIAIPWMKKLDIQETEGEWCLEGGREIPKDWSSKCSASYW